MQSLKQSILSRLLKGREVTENSCWLYKGPSGILKKEIYIDRKNFLVHRVSAYIHLGLDLFGTELVCHKSECKNKACWNPEHIYIGNTSTNTKDAIRDGTFRNPNTNKEFCKQGHKLSGLNLYVYTDKNGHTHRWCRTCRTRLSNANR